MIVVSVVFHESHAKFVRLRALWYVGVHVSSIKPTPAWRHCTHPTKLPLSCLM